LTPALCAGDNFFSLKGNQMKTVLIQEIAANAGQEIKIRGWVQTVRNQKTVQFIILRDHTGQVQTVLERSEAHAEQNTLIANLSRESLVEIVGEASLNPKVSLGGVEVQIKDIQLISAAADPLPIDLTGKTETMVDKRMDWRFLDLRLPENLLVFQVQTTVEAAMRDFWLKEGFIEIHTPKLMGSPSESGAELFSLEYFGQTAYLSQSPQFYKQMAMAAGFNRVFEIGPVFRADPSFTPRHTTEFTGVDIEVSWIDSHEEVMNWEERSLQQVLQTVSDKHGEAIKKTFGVDVVVPQLPFPRIPLAEAVAIVKSEGHVPPSDSKAGDLDPQGERVLCEYVARTLKHEFVFVTDYPKTLRPFYHMRHEDDPGKTKSFDLLWKRMEITTGAQREHRLERLSQQALELGLTLESIDFYLNFFKYGCPPHGGYGLGLARLLAVLLDRSSIRETQFLFRGPNRLSP
jgi:aspartyl-tRNA synthetase